MTAFSDSAFKGKLKDLNSTQQSIQTISLWAIHHRKHHAKIVAIWNEELLEAREAGRKLTLLYFANDVIQNMRKKGPEFQNEFRTALPSAVESAARAAKVEGDEKVAKSLLRLVNVWRERNIFDDPYIVRLENVISGAPLITEAAKPAATILKAPVVIASPSAAMTPKTPTSEPSSLPKRIKIDADFQSFNAKKPVVVKPPEPRGSDDEDYEEVTLNGDLDPPKLETLLRLIQKLQSAPSTNAAIRSRIAELPSVITDPVAIDKLSDRQEVERLVKVAKDGLEVVISYNKELGEELHDRQAVASELARQLAFHRKLIEEKEKLREVRSRYRQLDLFLANYSIFVFLFAETIVFRKLMSVQFCLHVIAFGSTSQSLLDSVVTNQEIFLLLFILTFVLSCSNWLISLYI